MARRVWAFIIDLALIGVLVALAWAPLALAIGPPLRFEPVFPILPAERSCETLGQRTTRDAAGAETRVREQVCTTTYAGLWKNRDYVRSEETRRGDTRTGSVTYYPVDEAGHPQVVLTDTLIAILVLILYFTWLEGAPSGMTLGKLALNMKVVGERGGPANRKAALARSLVKMGPLALMYAAALWLPPALGRSVASPAAVSGTVNLVLGFLALAGFALTLVTVHRRALHDLVAGTVVVTVP